MAKWWLVDPPSKPPPRNRQIPVEKALVLSPNSWATPYRYLSNTGLRSILRSQRQAIPSARSGERHFRGRHVFRRADRSRYKRAVTLEVLSAMPSLNRLTRPPFDSNKSSLRKLELRAVPPDWLNCQNVASASSCSPRLRARRQVRLTASAATSLRWRQLKFPTSGRG